MGDNWFYAEEGKKNKDFKYVPKSMGKSRIPFDAACMIVVFLIFTLKNYVYHSTMLASEAYSSPSIIMSGRRNDGTRYIIDDYREAYYWIKQNTPKESKIMSWWDYGY
jgi:dolichyl-diphosphooligosaccharide--protein glycosyltransferase